MEAFTQVRISFSTRFPFFTAFLLQLTSNIPLSAERIHRIRFRDSFDRFIVNVRGFLFVK